ncbi:MAG: hypothetical protein Q8K86_05880 [Candidatus Nanopelagicaceae bacterium]|nr:hypothetical protein [Candidatus Nanopelagicaceae bacterium]
MAPKDGMTRDEYRRDQARHEQAGASPKPNIQPTVKLPQELVSFLKKNAEELSGMAGQKSAGLGYGTQPQTDEEFLKIYNQIIGHYGRPTRLLGAGEMGQAWLTDDGSVMKITTDRLEARTAEKLKLRDIPGVAKIYDVAQLGDHELFVVSQEFAKGTDLTGHEEWSDDVKQQITTILRTLQGMGIDWYDAHNLNYKVDSKGRVKAFDIATQGVERHIWPRRMKVEERIYDALTIRKIVLG